MRSLAGHPELCAINTATLGFQAPIDEVIEAVARAGFGGIAPWRREVEGNDVGSIARHIRKAGLAVTGYCRSTYIPAADRAGFQANVEANRAALRDAAMLGANSFVLVAGSLPAGSKDMKDARNQVADAIGLLLETGRSMNMRLALEPLHPVYAAERSCVTLLSEALDLCEAIEGGRAEPLLGVCIDVYHLWWDPHLSREIARAGRQNRIFGFHVCDWLVPTLDVLNDRGMMGDGIIDIPLIRGWVEGAGYGDLIEAEIFSQREWWKRPMEDTLAVCRERFARST